MTNPILSLSIPSKDTLHASYMSFIKGGGIYIPAKSWASYKMSQTDHTRAR